MEENALRKKIEAVASNNVQERIRAFKKRVVAALRELHPGIERRGWSPEDIASHRKWPEDHREILALLASDDNTAGWPKALWDEEEKAVGKQMMGELDILHRLLLTEKEKVTNKPAAEKKDGKKK